MKNKKTTSIISICRNLFFSTLITFTSLNLYAQNNGNNGLGVTQWKTNGNIADSNHFIGTKNDFPVKFRSNDIERMRISPNGYIGIGISNPQTKFHVLGTSTFEGEIKLPLLNNTNSTDFLQNNFSLLLLNNSSSNVTRMDQIGFQRLLIDLSYSPLPIGPISECDLVLPNGNPINGRWINAPSILFTNCPEVNVGIATNTPRVKLDVNGGSFMQSIALGEANPINNNYVFDLKVPYTDNNFNKKIFHIANANRELMSLNNNGKLSTLEIMNQGLINSQQITIDITNISPNTTPLLVHNDGYKLLQLDQNGILHTRTVKVDVYNWPDFVFEENYQLPTLSEIRNHIDQHGHLPNIPDAETVEKGGLDLGEMNKLLLQKIEELTLYIIDQEKRIEKLENNANH